MNPKQNLQGKCIWITRPETQADNLLGMIGRAGGAALHLPMMRISPLPVDEAIRSRVLALDKYDFLVFISTNAATIGLDLIGDYWPQFPAGIALYAVGPTTAAVIETYGLAVEYPARRMSSEGLLELPSLAEPAGKKALIIRGTGGRDVLARALRDRGAQVDYLEVYRRLPPDIDSAGLGDLLRNQAPAAIVVTSTQALVHMYDLFMGAGTGLPDCPLLVSSERIAADAKSLGFKRVITMPGADDQAIMQGLSAIG